MSCYRIDSAIVLDAFGYSRWVGSGRLGLAFGFGDLGGVSEWWFGREQ